MPFHRIILLHKYSEAHTSIQHTESNNIDNTIFMYMQYSTVCTPLGISHLFTLLGQLLTRPQVTLHFLTVCFIRVFESRASVCVCVCAYVCECVSVCVWGGQSFLRPC